MKGVKKIDIIKDKLFNVFIVFRKVDFKFVKEFLDIILKLKDSFGYVKFVKKYFLEYYDNFIVN